ncbi:hypothetical protein IQ241_09850 [Romeria aff. gracilis LEGE 07310]|uniref:Uncharacterized protein n=2 Tax=Vasconcelosia TaxID=3366328 RepID=A0A8J7ANX2_9CYAN|nr:hypothetical protein [Romeria aff. gracilis LEGE 07310]
MRYLAKIHQKSATGEVLIQLLAHQRAEYLWETVTEEKLVMLEAATPFNEGLLVILDLDSQEAVTDLQDASDWVMEIVSQYLSQGMTPGALREEFNRVEQWRQSLTLQGQEVRRRALETAARRDEIQELEKNLKRKYEELEQRE